MVENWHNNRRALQPLMRQHQKTEQLFGDLHSSKEKLSGNRRQGIRVSPRMERDRRHLPQGSYRWPHPPVYRELASHHKGRGDTLLDQKGPDLGMGCVSATLKTLTPDMQALINEEMIGWRRSSASLPSASDWMP